MDTIETALARLVQQLSTLPGIRCIGISGGERALPRPGEGDIDLFLYGDEIPPAALRAATLAALGSDVADTQFDRISGGNWGVGDSVLLCGVETWMMYFTEEETRADIASILSGSRPDREGREYYPTGRLAMFQGMRILYPGDGFLASVQEMLYQMPDALGERLIAYHLDALGDTETLERAVLRREVLLWHAAFDTQLDHFLQALFAVNRVYFPSRKRTLSHIAAFPHLPVDCTARLLDILRLGGMPETLPEARGKWAGLVGDLTELAGKSCSSC